MQSPRDSSNPNFAGYLPSGESGPQFFRCIIVVTGFLITKTVAMFELENTSSVPVKRDRVDVDVDVDGKVGYKPLGVKA
jgi:hypothetical protein